MNINRFNFFWLKTRVFFKNIFRGVQSHISTFSNAYLNGISAADTLTINNIILYFRWCKRHTAGRTHVQKPLSGGFARASADSLIIGRGTRQAFTLVDCPRRSRGRSRNNYNNYNVNAGKSKIPPFPPHGVRRRCFIPAVRSMRLP